ncbi:MAG TPA: hypothetical protein VNX28_19175 [Gemmataceae bacterium]|nr:hypothetical protein [Gemmataceae bacterium]
MPTTKHTPDELACLGGDIFDRQVRSALRPEDDGKFVAIDVETGDYEIDEDDYLGDVQTAAGGAGSIRTITGYVTDQLAVNVRQPGYLQRLADTVGGRLGGQWMARLEASGNRTHLILERAP